MINYLFIIIALGILTFFCITNYNYYKLVSGWEKIEGEEIPVRSIFAKIYFFPIGRGGAKDSIKLQKDGFVLKNTNFSPFSQTPILIKYSDIKNVVIKRTILSRPDGTYRSIEINLKNKLYVIILGVNLEIYNRLKPLFSENQIQIIEN
ncbi:MAG: hypothetical protein HY918_01920 [Candidatus Doudnabacteria bacterium]|nr:hypothetical protein [Candidatus Doudnabacteria bacterium]